MDGQAAQPIRGSPGTRPLPGFYARSRKSAETDFRASRGMTVRSKAKQPPEREPGQPQFFAFTRTALSPAMSSGWAATTRPSFTRPNTGMLAVMASWSVAEKGLS